MNQFSVSPSSLPPNYFLQRLFLYRGWRVTDEMPLRSTIYAELRDYASNNVARKVGCILDLLKLSAQVDDFPASHQLHPPGQRHPESEW